MYIWNVKALAEDLKTDKLTQKDKMKYYLLVSLFPQILLIWAMNASLSINFADNITYFIDILIDFIGIFLCYEANRLGDNKNFIDRIICLSVPIGLRVLIMSLVTFTVLIIIYSSQVSSLVFDLISLPIICLLNIFHFTLLRSYILDISGANRKHDTDVPPTA